ncbi:acetylxylan esterase, partial [Bacillus altitudinis]|uniref:acetylxylan esterase n=1 Tax=Bacillus altitudinis TaxID=293387 RepID=UPI00119FC83D
MQFFHLSLQHLKKYKPNKTPPPHFSHFSNKSLQQLHQLDPHPTLQSYHYPLKPLNVYPLTYQTFPHSKIQPFYPLPHQTRPH